MEMSHQGGAEAESLLRSDQRNGAIVSSNTRVYGFHQEPLGEEKAPFLHNEPVRLTPAWESSNLPNDTLNLKGVAADLAPPRDRLNLIYITLILHGIGTLAPWNMFITAKSYFTDYKLVESQYKENFLVYLGYASQIPNLSFAWFNVFAQLGGDLTSRIVWSLSFEVVIFVVTIGLAMADSKAWSDLFFWITIVTVGLLNVFNAIFQNTVYGVAAKLPPKYTGAVVLGSNICGTLTVLLEWLSSSLSSNFRTSAIYYFIGGMMIMLACFDTYFALPLNRFFRYHDTLQERTARNNPALASTNQNATDRKQRPPFKTIIRQCKAQLFNVFLTFFVSLAVFPTVLSDVLIEKDSNFFIDDQRMFTRITCFLTFNALAMIGNVTANLIKFPTPKLLVVFTILRIAFIPFFLLCNYHPGGATSSLVRTMPILVHSQYFYFAMSIILGWSSGHCSSLAMMYVSQEVAPENAATAGMMGAACLVTGLISGIAFSNLCPLIVTSSIWT